MGREHHLQEYRERLIERQPGHRVADWSQLKSMISDHLGEFYNTRR